ncbi:MAG: hypothetical protein II295_02145 [Akkermansia sp.]|nr:hypothetical protein [Akkermansia sp.]
MKIEPTQKQAPKYPAIVKAAAVIATAAALSACQQQTAGQQMPDQATGGVIISGK